MQEESPDPGRRRAPLVALVVLIVSLARNSEKATSTLVVDGRRSHAFRDFLVAITSAALVSALVLFADDVRQEDRHARSNRAELLASVMTKDDVRGIVLRGQDLEGLVLASRDGTDADFRDAELTSANFELATLDNAQFDGAVLDNASFVGASLQEARFSGASLTYATFAGGPQQSGMWFDHANLKGSMFTDMSFSKAHMRGAVLQDIGTNGADFSGANLRYADFRGADLRISNMSSASLGAICYDGDTLWPANIQPPPSVETLCRMHDSYEQLDEPEKSDLPAARFERLLVERFGSNGFSANSSISPEIVPCVALHGAAYQGDTDECTLYVHSAPLFCCDPSDASAKPAPLIELGID